MRAIKYLPFILIVLCACACQTGNKEATATNDGVEKLLLQMTLEEKIGQMTQLCFSTMTLGRDKILNMDYKTMQNAIVNYHVGSFISGTGSLQEWNTFLNQAQKIAMEETRLKIPLLFGIDHIHGANY
ncbi:MAG: hypothetical protein HC896_10620 [Bacteroidales bacterium]|nr:hypothetical protein [Bacteroidales bacterium]